MVPLSTLVSTRRIAGPEYTNRFNLYRAAQVLGSAAPGYSSGQALVALEEWRRKSLRARWGMGSRSVVSGEEGVGTAGPIFALSLGFVFLILAASYESWSLPFYGANCFWCRGSPGGVFSASYLRNFDLGSSPRSRLAIADWARRPRTPS